MSDKNNKMPSIKNIPPAPPFRTNKNKIFASGAQRGEEQKTNYHSISPIGLRRLAETHFNGDNRYGLLNWEKGMPISGLLNHSIAHIFKYLNGDTSEDHLAHATWGLMAAMDMEENHPDLDHELRFKVNNAELSLPINTKFVQSEDNSPESRSILIEVTDPNAVIPIKAYKGDAGHDLTVIYDFSIEPGQVLDVPLGYNIKISNGYWGSIKARSSTLIKMGLIIMEGVIDSNYTGPMSIVIKNPTDEDIMIKAGQRLAQLVVIPDHQLKTKVVKEMPPTNRGSKGFGSSGK